MRNACITVFIFITSLLSCSDMFEDLALYSGDGFGMTIYAYNGTNLELHTSTDGGKTFSLLQSNVFQWNVNKYNEVLLEQQVEAQKYVRIIRPGEGIRDVGFLGSDYVTAIAPLKNGDFYICTNISATQQIYILPRGANEMQMYTDLSGVSGLGNINNLWILPFQGRELFYICDNNFVIYISVDNGKTFQSTLIPSYLPTDMISFKNRIYISTNPDAQFSQNGYSFNTISFFTGKSIVAFTSDNSGRIYALEIGLLYFSDDGDNWQSGTTLPGATAFDIASDHTGRLYILDGTGLFVSNDRGISAGPYNMEISGFSQLKIVEWK